MKMDILRSLTEDAGDEAMLEAIALSLSSFARERSNLIPVLQFIQREHAYLSEKALRIVAQHFGISASEIGRDRNEREKLKDEHRKQPPTSSVVSSMHEPFCSLPSVTRVRNEPTRSGAAFGGPGASSSSGVNRSKV